MAGSVFKVRPAGTETVPGRDPGRVLNGGFEGAAILITSDTAVQVSPGGKTLQSPTSSSGMETRVASGYLAFYAVAALRSGAAGYLGACTSTSLPW